MISCKKFVFLKSGLAAILLLTLSLASQSNAQSNPAPDAPGGWTKTKVRTGKPHVAFTHDKVKSPDVLAVRYYDRELLVDSTLAQWTQNKLASTKPPLGGQWSGPIEEFTRQTANFYTAKREFKVDDQPHVLMINAVCVDKLHVRMSAIVQSQTAGAKRYKNGAAKLLYGLVTVEKEAAKKDNRGLSLEQNPPKIKSLKSGGPIKPGLYVGTGVSRKDNKTAGRYDLVMFENGEYEFLGGKKRDSTGQFTYSSATGRLQINGPFENHYSRAKEEFCVYGTDSKGNRIIHAQSKYWLYRLKWAKESDRLSPSEVKRQKEIAAAEAKRYKHVTEPGQGIGPDEIEAVMYTWEMPFRNGAAQLDHFGYLLMKDGRVLDGLPCSPDSIDLAASRSRQPDSWGWWRKAKDDKQGRFEFAWPSRPQDYRMPKGNQVIGVPIPKGTRLSGDYGATSTTVMLVSNYSSVRWWGIKFNKNGRFMNYRNGSTQIGGVPGMETLTTVAWDDQGSASSIVADNFGGGTKRKFNNPVLDRMGSYEFDGYRLTLKFDSKRVEHHPTFSNKENSSIWFKGHVLSKKKPKAENREKK